MAYAPKPSFTKEDSQPIVIQNKMPKQGETDVTGNIPGGGGNSTFRLVGNTSTQPAATTTTSSNPYPFGYTSGMPQGLDTVSGPGAVYNPSTGNTGGNTGGNTTPGGITKVTGPFFEDTDPVQYVPSGGGLQSASGPFWQDNYPQNFGGGGGLSLSRTSMANNITTGNNNTGPWYGSPTGATQTAPAANPNYKASNASIAPPPGIDYSSWQMFLNSPNGASYLASQGGGVTPPRATGRPVLVDRNPMPMPIPATGGSANAMYNKGGVTSGGNGSPYLGPPGGSIPMGNRQPATGPNGGVAQPNRDRFQGWHMGSGAWQSAPGRGPAAPTWMGGSYNPWTGQPGDPAMAGGTDNLRMMNSGTSTGPVTNPPIRPTSGGGGGGGFFRTGVGQTDAQTTGGFDPTQNHPNYPGTGYGRNWTSGPYFQIPQGWNTAGPPGRSQQGGNYTPAGPDYTPPGKTEVGGNAVRVGVPRPNEQGAQRGWRYQQAGVPIYNDQLPPVGGNAAPAGSDMAAREPGYLGPPVQQNFPPFPPFDPQNPPSPQQWLEIVRQWMAQFPRGGNPNQWQGQAPSNPIQNPTWGAPWPGWQGGDLRNFPPSRPPGGTR